MLSIIVASTLEVVAPFYYKKFFDELTTDPVRETLVKILMVVLVIHLISWIFFRIAFFANSFFQTSIMRDLANFCFAYLHKHSFSFFNNNFVGSLVKKVNRFYRAFEGIADALTWEFLPVFIEVVLISVVLFTRSSLLGYIIIGWVVVYCSVNYFFSIYKLKYDIKRTEYESKVTGIMADTITNHVNVKLFCGYSRERNYFGKWTKELNDLRRFTWDLNNIFDAVQTLLMIGLEIGIFYFAIDLFDSGVLTTGDFVLIQAYLITVFRRLWGFGRIIRHFYERLADAEEMTEVLDQAHEIVDIKNAKNLAVSSGLIEFDNVTFCYRQTRKVLNKFNLKIEPGERIALVGPSGAGKSTVVKLLLRLYNVSSGEIKIDGQDIAKVTQESLWKNVGLVPQDTILFHRTLKQNIRYGKPNATNKEIINASKLAHCHEFIKSFPENYSTYVGERGVKLSGGERQRVAIARAILRNAPILILDEATSSLDSESEGLIQDALGKLMKDKTVIVIAHRLSTIMKMDRIVVIDKEGIVEQGTHAELLKKGKTGIYQKLWKLQAGGFIE